MAAPRPPPGILAGSTSRLTGFCDCGGGRDYCFLPNNISPTAWRGGQLPREARCKLRLQPVLQLDFPAELRSGDERRDRDRPSFAKATEGVSEGQSCEARSAEQDGGRDRDRTCDPYHVKVVLYR